MKVTPNKDKIIAVRVPAEDYDLFKYTAKNVGVSVSKLLYMYFNATVIGIKDQIDKGVISYEDIERICNN